MASAADLSQIARLRTEPLRGGGLAAAAIGVWIAGALYCSGYEALASGLDNWPGSLWWSAVAVPPWLALFEWSKTEAGMRKTRPAANLAIALAATAAVSLTVELAVAAALGSPVQSPALSLLRRLPAIGICLLLILWSRAGRSAGDTEISDEKLAAMAPSIDWVATADNYVEIHLGGQTLTRRMTMRQAERMLAPHGFVRIHRRFLVNRARIERAGGSGEWTVQLLDGTKLPVGRAFAANLKAAG